MLWAASWQITFSALVVTCPISQFINGFSGWKGSVRILSSSNRPCWWSWSYWFRVENGDISQMDFVIFLFSWVHHCYLLNICTKMHPGRPFSQLGTRLCFTFMLLWRSVKLWGFYIRLTPGPRSLSGRRFYLSRVELWWLSASRFVYMIIDGCWPVVFCEFYQGKIKSTQCSWISNGVWFRVYIGVSMASHQDNLHMKSQIWQICDVSRIVGLLSPNFRVTFCRWMSWYVLRNLKTFLNLDALHFVMRVFPNSQSQMQWSLWAWLNIIHQLLANWVAFSNEWFQHRAAHGWHIWYWFQVKSL